VNADACVLATAGGELHIFALRAQPRVDPSISARTDALPAGSRHATLCSTPSHVRSEDSHSKRARAPNELGQDECCYEI
jgi:hypothetical protein